MKDLNLRKIGFLLLFFLFTLNYASAQDLGSSNKLFNAAKTKPESKPTPKRAEPKKAEAKKTAPKTAASSKTSKPKPAAPRKTNVAGQPKTETAKNESKPKTQPKQTQSAAKKNASNLPPEDIIITVGKTTKKENTTGKTAASKENTSVNTPPTKENKENFDELFEQAIADGNAARDERDYNKAEAAYLRAQSLKTSDSRAAYGLGNLYSDQQRWEEAERAYRTAIQLEPTAPESYIALSFILTQPITGMELGDRYAEAEKLARQALQIDPNNALSYDQLGVALELQGKISGETQNAYKKAIALDPSFALAYAHLGRLLRRKGLKKESAAADKDAIRLATDVPTMILVADVMQSQQRYDESEQLLRRALKDDPKNPTALYLLGRALTISGNFDEAEKVLKKSAEVSPNSFTSYVLLGSLFVRREKFDDADKYLMKASVMVSPNERKRLSHEFEVLGDGYLRAGKNKDAARAFRQAATFDRENAAIMEKLNKTQATLH